MEAILELGTSAQGATVRKCRTPHPHADIGLFTSRTIEVKKVARIYYGSLMYTNLNTERHKIKTYGKEDTQMISDTFLKWQSALPKKAMKKNEIVCKVCVVPERSFFMSGIIDDRYLPGDTSFEAIKVERSGKNSLQFMRGKTLLSITYLKRFRTSSIQVLRNIALYTEQLLLYENKDDVHFWTRNQ